MSRAYTEAIQHHCPNATLVIDRFHVVKALNEAVDAVRKEQWRSLEGDKKKAIKGLRWLLAMHSRNRSKSPTRLIHKLRNANRRIHRAWVLKDEFEHFWNYSYLGSAENLLKSLATAALKSRIPSLRKFVGTLREHWENILAFIQRPLTNAAGEGLNRIIKIVKNRACRISQSGELHRPDLSHRRRPPYPCANPESASHIPRPTISLDT
jgi:transposase